MANSLGGLIVTLGLNAAEYVTGLTKAEYEAKKSLDNITSTVKKAAAAIGVSLSAAAFIGFIKSTIDAEDHLNDLSKATGIAVETLGGLGFAAKQAGIDGDSLAKAVGKLNLEIASALGGNEKALTVFKNLRISFDDLKKSTPDQILTKVAQAFSESEDGAIKASYGSALFKKEYQAIIPLLDEGGQKLQKNIDYYAKYSGVSAETARKADEFNDTLVKLNLLSGAFGKTLVAELLTPLQHVADALLQAKENGDQFKGFAQDAASIIKGVGVVAIAVTTEIAGLGHALGAIAAEANRLAHFDLAGAKAIEVEATKEQDARYARAKQLIDAINNPSTASGAYDPRLDPNAPKKKRTLPTIDTSGGAADAEAKAKLAKDLAEQENYIKSEQDLLKQREAFLQDYYQHSEIGVAEYFAARQGIITEALNKQELALDEEERILRASISRAKPTERAEGEKKLADVIAHRARLEQDAAAESVRGYIEQGRAVEVFRDKVEEASLRVLSLRGTNVESNARAEFDFQNREIIKQIELEKQSNDEKIRGLALIGSKYIDELRERTAQQAKLNEAERQYSNALEAISIRSARIDLGVQTGALTEIDAINAKAALAASSIGALTAKLQEYQDAANKASEGPIKDAALLKVEQMKLAIDQLAAASDVLAKKFNDVFAGAVSDGIVKLITETRNWKDALNVANDVAKQISNSIVKIASDQVSGQLFAKGGVLGGVGDFFAGIFGGKKGSEATGAAALTTAGSTLTIAGTGLNTAAIGLNAAALALSASSATSAVSSAFGKGNEDLGDLLGLFGDVPFVGSGKGANGSAALTAAGSSLTIAGSTLTLAGTGLSATALALDTAALALNAAALAMSASSAADAVSSAFGKGSSPLGQILGLFGDVPMAAGGGYLSAGKAALIGEKGPELFIPKTSGTVIPNSVISQRRVEKQQSVTLHYYAAPGVSKQTAHQHAVDMARTIDTARKLNR